MKFNQKLKFMLNITATSNIQIANALNMAPSTISQYKTGKRNQPKKASTIRLLANFFSIAMNTEYQFSALADVTGLDIITSDIKKDLLSDIIFEWFSSDKVFSSKYDSISLFETINTESSPSEEETDPVKPRGSSELFTGVEGKREAFIKFFNYAKDHKVSKKFYYLAEDNASWFLDDQELQSVLIDYFHYAAHNRTEIIHFLPPPSFDYFYETVTSLLMDYCNGMIQPYHYPRFRDNFSRAMLMYIPGVIVYETFSLAGGNGMPLVLLSTDPKVLKTFDSKIDDMMHSYHPVINNTNITKQREVIASLQKNETERFIIKSASLSRVTFPDEIIDKTDYKTAHPFLYDRGAIISNIFKNQLNEKVVFDICALPEVEEIKSGTVPMPLPCSGDQLFYYDTKSFIAHLQNILRLMDKYPDYHFIPYKYDKEQKITLYYGYSSGTFVVRLINGKLLNIAEPNMNRVIEEYLSIIIASKNFDFKNKSHVKSIIEKLIYELSM